MSATMPTLLGQPSDTPVSYGFAGDERCDQHDKPAPRIHILIQPFGDLLAVRSRARTTYRQRTDHGTAAGYQGGLPRRAKTLLGMGGLEESRGCALLRL